MFTLVYNCVVAYFTLLYISYSFRKSSAEVSRSIEVVIPKSCPVRDRAGRQAMGSITS